MKDNYTRGVHVKQVIEGGLFIGTMYAMPQEILLHNQVFLFIGIDVPNEGEIGFHQTQKFLTNMMEDKVIHCTIHGKNEYGQYLVTAYTETSESSINDALIIRGLATIPN